MENTNQVEEIKTAVTQVVDTKTQALESKNAELESKNAELTGQVEEVKNLAADLEAKMADMAAAPAVQEVEFDKKAASDKLRTAMNKETATGQVEIKALTIAGAGGESLAIDDELARTVIERARENVAILGAIGSQNVGSVNHRQMVLQTYPAVGETGENTTLAGADWSATDTQTYVEVVMKVGKIYAKPQITDEAAADPAIDLWSHLETLLADELSRKWAQQVLAGDGSANQINGILYDGKDAGTTGHLDTRDATDDGTQGESWKDALNRDAKVFPILPTGVAGGLPAAASDFIDLLIDTTVVVPSAYLSTSRWYMNRRVQGAIRKLKDADGRPLLQFEGGAFNLLGHPVVLEDYMPNAAADSFPIIFGDLNKAYRLCNIDETYLIDPYSVDGATQIKTSSRKGSLIGNNDAIVVVMCTDKDGE